VTLLDRNNLGGIAPMMLVRSVQVVYDRYSNPPPVDDLDEIRRCGRDTFRCQRGILAGCHILTKYGMATIATPRMTSNMVFETKYGKIIRATPQTSGTTAFCRLPYTKKPSPIDPNSNPQRSDDVSIGVGST
jgi:hypothetical protein